MEVVRVAEVRATEVVVARVTVEVAVAKAVATAAVATVAKGVAGAAEDQTAEPAVLWDSVARFPGCANE